MTPRPAILAPLLASLIGAPALADDAVDRGAGGAKAAVPAGAAIWRTEHAEAIRADDELVRLADVDLGDGRPITLELRRDDAALDDATIEIARFVREGRGGRIESRTGAAPQLAIRRGVARGAKGELLGEAWVAVGRSMLGGFVRLEEGVRFISSGPHGGDRLPLAFDPSSVAASLLPQGGAFCTPLLPPTAPEALPVEGGAAGAVTQCYELAIAVETDREFTTALFGGDLDAAAEYALALIGASGEIFTLDLGVRFRTAYLRLWEDEDPWTQTSTVDQLLQFRDHWSALMTEVPRDLAHFLSGRGLGGGVAWLPGLCGGYSYALSANLGGSFPYPLEDHRHENWDIMVVSHEFGHNVGAPHTHSVTPPLDGCGNGDCSAAYGGTIMSYCHLCSGGLSNIALEFHPGSVGSMLALLDSVPCDYSGGPEPIAGEDAAIGLAGETLLIDVLRNDRGGDCSEISIAGHDPVTAAGHPVAIVTGEDARPWISVHAGAGATGEDSFSYTVIDALGGTAIGEVAIDWRLPRPALPIVGAAPGVIGKHFEIPESSVLPDFATLAPVAGELAPRVDYPSTDGVFAGSGRADLVASLYLGWLEVPSTGIWRLFTDSDDGSRLWIGSSLVVDNDGLHGMLERSGEIALAAGRHPIRIEFFENYGGAGLIVRWQGPETPKSVVPDEAWSHGGSPATPDLDGDGQVGGSDLASLLAAWGSCADCPADLDADGTVGGADLTLLLGAWGPVGG